MNIVVRWLNQFLSEPLSSTQVANALEAAGMEVEDLWHPPEFDNEIITAEVMEVKSHPNADKLQLAVVKDGSRQHEVVCGAPNLHAGQRVVWARPGATLPDGTVIEQTTIRDVTSEGMLCSERELGLGSAHEGLLDVGPEADIGVPLHTVFTAEYTVIEAKTAANRWDLQSYVGIAREVAAHTGVDLVDITEASPKGSPQRVENMFVNQVPEQVPFYGLVRLELDAEAATPPWMRTWLRLSGVKPVNAVVDLTNYVMLHSGQPLHAFDAGAVQGGVEVRFAAADETLTTLDGVERTLSSDDLVIADAHQPIALAGVIGGQTTEINDQTTTIILESATFDGALVRKTAKRHGLRTGASARFERGLPLHAPRYALRQAVSMLGEYAEATALRYQHERNAWPWVQHIGVRVSRMRTLLGMEDVTREDIASNLGRLHFDAEPFDIVAAARQQVGKPYKFGANYKTDGSDAFDCSYLIDYLYSLIGVRIGHTALGQYELGEPVDEADLLPGDVLFMEGKIEHSATDHYYKSDNDGNKMRYDLDDAKPVGHNGMYIGDGRVVMAAQYSYQEGEWREREEQGVVETDLEEFTGNPGYLGARRYVDDLADYVRATVPWWRPDVRNEQDILEEVVKLFGLDSLPSSLPPWHPVEAPTGHPWQQIDELRWLLYGFGLHEVATYPFISEEDIAMFRQPEQHLKLANPRSSEQAYLRSSLLPLLTYAVANNTSYSYEFGVFECARVFMPEEGGQSSRESTKLSIVYQGEDVLHLKGILDGIAKHAHLSPDIRTETEYPFLHPTRQARLELDGDVLGYYGMLHPEIEQSLKPRQPILCAELDMEVLRAHWQPAQFQPLPKYPSGYRDVTVVVDPQVSWQDVCRALEGLEALRVAFRDEYHREDSRKAVTLHVEVQAREATLTDEAIEARLQEVAATLERELDADVPL